LLFKIVIESTLIIKGIDGGLCFNNWIIAIQNFKQKNYKIVLPGHGKPTDSSIFDEVNTYLEFVKFELGTGKNGEELIESIKTRFPNYILDLTLLMPNYILFEFQA